MKLLAAFLLAMALLAPANAQTPFAREKARIDQAKESGSISVLEAEKEVLASAKANFPTDYPLHEMIASLITYAELLQDGSMTEDQYNKKRGERISRYNIAVRERNEAIDRQRADQASAERNQNIFRALGAGAAGMQRSIDQRPQTCTWVATGNVKTKQCY